MAIATTLIKKNNKIIINNNKVIINSKGNIPRYGLIGEWLFDGNADDTSGNGNDGTRAGNRLPTLANGKDGGANKSYFYDLFFNSGYITFGDPAILQNIQANDFSLSQWIYISKNATNTILGSIWSSYNGAKGVLIREGAGTSKRQLFIVVYFTTTHMVYRTTDILDPYTWYNTVTVFDSSTKTAKIYVDGTEATYGTSQAGSGSLISDIGTDKQIGQLSISNTSQSFYGYNSLNRLYNRVLTQEEITILANE